MDRKFAIEQNMKQQMQTAKANLDKIFSNKFVTDNSTLKRKWHNAAIAAMKKGLILMGEAGKIDTEFLEKIKPMMHNDMEFWQLLKDRYCIV